MLVKFQFTKQLKKLVVLKHGLYIRNAILALLWSFGHS